MIGPAEDPIQVGLVHLSFPACGICIFLSLGPSSFIAAILMVGDSVP